MAKISGGYSVVQTISPDIPRSWLRCPLLPSLDRPFYIESVSNEERDREEGVFYPLGGRFPVVVSGVRRGGSLSVRFTTTTRQERNELVALLDSGNTLYFMRPAEGDEPDFADYVVPVGPIKADRALTKDPSRYISVEFLVTARP